LSQTSPSRISISWMPAIVGHSASACIDGTQAHQIRPACPSTAANR
jgi:hypothetical protein